MEAASNITRVVNRELLTGNFVLPRAPVDDILIAENSIKIEMPNRVIERSTHMCYLRIPHLPKELRETHIVPGLSYFSSISIKQLCRGGCVVIFKDKICEVWHRGILVLTGKDIGPGGLWNLPINGQANLDKRKNNAGVAKSAQHCHCHSTSFPVQREKVKYMHQTYFRNVTC